MTWLKVLESTNMQTEASMLATGTKTSNTDLEKKNGMTQACIRASIRMQVRRAKENIAGLMATDTLENGVKTCSTEEACSSGMTKGFSLENGKTT
jgi:3-deoxy-D-arabino-heptulosonate 7-phosphate (DAHP) synthase